MSYMHSTAVVIVHYGDIKTTIKCLKAIKSKIETNTVILVNNSTQDIKSLSKIIPGTKIIDNLKNVGFARAVNQGIMLATTDSSIDSIFLLNNDAYQEIGTLRQLQQSLFEKKKIGMLSPALRHSGDLYDWGGHISRWTGAVRHQNFQQRPKKKISVSHIAAAAMLIKKEVIDKIGLFDERFFMYFEDADFCLRVKKNGYLIQIEPQVVFTHEISQSSDKFSRTFTQWQSHLYFALKYTPATIYPTAFLYNILVYPLFLLKSLLLRK